MDYAINNQWDELLKQEFEKDYFKKIVERVDYEYDNFNIFPPKEQIFSALKLVDYDDARVCILGQDPYHGYGQANGMAFAVNDGVKQPPSLANIFTELKNDLDVNKIKSPSLLGWAKQGVLLLNTTLTVKEGQPQSHEGIGWNIFTDSIIKKLSDRIEPLVFILWGSSAIAKKEIINSNHCIICCPHPSPLSAYRGFFGSKPFSRANDFLLEKGFEPIDWSDTLGQRASYYNGKGNIYKVKC